MLKWFLSFVWKLTRLFVEHLERFDHLMRYTFNNAHSCFCLLFEVSQIEWHISMLVSYLKFKQTMWCKYGLDSRLKNSKARSNYLSDECPRCFQFKLVVFVGFLENWHFCILFAANTLPGANQYIDGIHLVQCKLAFFMLFALCLIRILDNRFFAIDFGLLELMAQHTFNRLALILAGNLLNGIGNCIILMGSRSKRRINAVLNSNWSRITSTNTYACAWFEKS